MPGPAWSMTASATPYRNAPNYNEFQFIVLSAHANHACEVGIGNLPELEPERSSPDCPLFQTDEGHLFDCEGGSHPTENPAKIREFHRSGAAPEAAMPKS